MLELYRNRFIALSMNTPITTYLQEKLTEVGTAGFEQLAADTGVKVSFIRKFFYGGRKDPRVNTIQPLLDHFQAQERPRARRRAASAAAPAQPKEASNV